MESEYSKTEKKALQLIARAEQCSAALARKLEMRGHDPKIIAEVISHLTEQKLIDDVRYARLWLQTRIRLPRSPKRLIAGLCAKGIRREEAEAALDSVFNADNGGEDAELAMLKLFVKKHARTSRAAKKPADQLKYFLKSEGFSKQAIEQLTTNNEQHNVPEP